MKEFIDFNLQEWLNYLENSHAQEIQLDLARIKQVAERLDLIRPQAKIITVAGTNGKGSTVAALEAIYHTAGYQVASYSSPHLVQFNERIRINRKLISDEDMCRAFTVIEQGRAQIPLTYFEITTLAALWHFKQHKLDVIILEVGLGGRLDATNIINCDLAIITTIDLDHQDYLGDTKEVIGYEKAGILRANRPFIFADKTPPNSILNHALALKAPTYINGRDYVFGLTEGTLDLHFQGELIQLPKSGLHPNSISAAIVASLLMKKDLPFDLLDWHKAIGALVLPGRFQLIHTAYTNLLDVAHNPQAATNLADFIRSYQPKKNVYAVFAALKDKDIAATIAPLTDCVDAWFPALLPVKRASSKEQLRLAFEMNHINSVIYENPLSAYKAATARAKPGDLIVVYGSFFTVAEVLIVLECDMIAV